MFHSADRHVLTTMAALTIFEINDDGRYPDIPASTIILYARPRSLQPPPPVTCNDRGHQVSSTSLTAKY